MKYKIFFSLKSKLITIFTLGLFLFSISTYIYIPSKIEEQRIEEIDSKIHTFAEIISTSINQAVFLEDSSSLNNKLLPLIKSEKLSYLVVHNKIDSIIYAFNISLAKAEQYKIDHKIEHISKNRIYYKANTLINFNDETIGEIYIGYSLTGLYSEINKLKGEIAIISLSILIIGYLITLIISNLLTIPIKRMVDIIEKIKEGDLTQRTNTYYNDEVGYLANSFNKMLDKIGETNHKLKILNEELENIISERTQKLKTTIVSLLRENKKRKKAEKARNKSEESFKRLFENATLGIYRVKKNGELLLANSALVKILGLENYEDIISFDNSQQMSDYFDSSVRTEFQKIINKEGNVYGFENKWKKKEGTIVYIRESARSVKDKNGRLLYYEGIVEDITSKKKMELELKDAKEKAESAEKLKSQFLAQMSHEIRTPINNILSYSQLLKEELINDVPEDLKFSFDMIDNGGRRLIRTIDLILNMSDIQNGNLEINLESVDVYDSILKPIIKEFRSGALSKNLELKLVNNNNGEVYKSNIDIYTVTQILTNLIDNAIKYTANGGIRIVSSINNKNLLCIDVIDTGIGISKEYQSRLFNPFSQEEQGYTRSYDGNGLGMALVGEYCKLNNISLSIKSQKGVGSTFTLVFPKSKMTGNIVKLTMNKVV